MLVSLLPTKSLTLLAVFMQVFRGHSLNLFSLRLVIFPTDCHCHYYDIHSYILVTILFRFYLGVITYCLKLNKNIY